MTRGGRTSACVILGATLCASPLLAAATSQAFDEKLSAVFRESAAQLARGCMPVERQGEFVDRFEASAMQALGPGLREYEAKIARASAALRAARRDYAACTGRANEVAASATEACAAEHAHLGERDATARALRSDVARDRLGRRLLPEFVRVLRPLATDFPECDLRKLQVVPPRLGT